VNSRVTDYFTCYIPAISADGQYVAYTKFFAPHGAPSPDDRALLYVVSESPAENRASGIRLDDHIDVGFAVYPAEIGNREADNVDVPPELAHTVGGFYIWKDSSRYIFADITANEFSVVSVTVDSGKADVRRLVIPPSQLGPLVSNYFPIRLSSATFENDKVRLILSSNITRPVVINMSDFVDVGSVNLTQRPKGSP
ncbi:MAG: hypothetical protein ACRD2S_12565, partial [Terriglobales bacterium]